MEHSATLVSCYYLLRNSKHSAQQYDKWIKNLLLNLTSNIIIFVGKNEEKYISQILQNNNLLKINKKTYLLIVKEFHDLPLVAKYSPDFWTNQENIDKQKWCGRGQGCYKLWNSKFHLLKEAIQLNPFKSDKFIWNDIGNIRNEAGAIKFLNTYPTYNRISSDKLDIVLLKPFHNQTQFFFQDEVHFSGSLFGGGKEILLELCELFYLYFDIYAKKNMFIGCDQQILATVYLKNREKFNCIVPPINCIDIDEWFYLYKYYSLL